MYCDWPQLGRCCFCLPLRRGVLTFGYIHIFFSALMVGIYSYSIHVTKLDLEPGTNTTDSELDSLLDTITEKPADSAKIAEALIYGRDMVLPSEACVVFYCLELIFDGLLIYSAHMKIVRLLRIFYYYTLTTCVALLIMELTNVFMNDSSRGSPIEFITFALAGLFLQLYLISLVRSLIRKLEISGPHVYGNQLHQIVNGEARVEVNPIYNGSTVVPEEY